MSAEVVVNEGALDQLLKSPDGEVAKDVMRRTLQVDRMAKRLCPVDTGRLHSSITWEMSSDGDGPYGVVGSNVVYARIIELGGVIDRPDWDANYDTGGAVSVQIVEAQPYLLPALAAVMEGG